MVQQQVEQQITEKILNTAVDQTDNKISYVTHVRFLVSNNDVILDLYYMSPNPQNPAGEPIATRLHRVVMPLSAAKSAGELLVKTTTAWEEAFGIELPITPIADRADLNISEVSDE